MRNTAGAAFLLWRYLNEDKKWKGTFRLTIPDENSQYFASNKRVFNNFIYSLETSNNGYHFDWDETKLKGKFFGALYREKEFESNSGDIITTTECGGSTDIASIRSGDFRLPAGKRGNTEREGFPRLHPGAIR